MPHYFISNSYSPVLTSPCRQCWVALNCVLLVCVCLSDWLVKNNLYPRLFWADLCHHQNSNWDLIFSSNFLVICVWLSRCVCLRKWQWTTGSEVLRGHSNKMKWQSLFPAFSLFYLFFCFCFYQFSDLYYLKALK